MRRPRIRSTSANGSRIAPADSEHGLVGNAERAGGVLKSGPSAEKQHHDICPSSPVIQLEPQGEPPPDDLYTGTPVILNHRQGDPPTGDQLYTRTPVDQLQPPEESPEAADELNSDDDVFDKLSEVPRDWVIMASLQEEEDLPCMPEAMFVNLFEGFIKCRLERHRMAGRERDPSASLPSSTREPMGSNVSFHA